MNPVLSLLYSQDCRTFVCFLKPTLTDLGALLEECVDDLAFPLKPSKTQNLSRCRACVVVITRGFLTFLETNRDFAYKIACCLQPSKTVALLVGVTEWDICCYHKTILRSYYGWTRFIATNNIIPSQAVCCIRDLIIGPAENTIRIQEKETTIKNMESLQALEETKDIQRKVGTMKNSYEETNEYYPTAQRDKTDDILGQKIKESSNVSEKEEDIQEKTIPESTESSETPKKTTNIEEQNSAEKHSELPKLLKRKNVIKKKKLVEKEKDGAEGSTEPFEPRKIKDDNQVKPINNKSETLKQMNVWENTAKENSESEKMGDVQEHLKLENNVEPEIKRSTSKNTERLKSRPTFKKNGMIGKHTNSFQLLDGEPVKTTETLEQLNEGEGSKKGEKECVETLRSSFTNYIQEQNDVQGAKRSVMPIRKSSKTKDTRTPNESELSETSEDTRRKRHLRYSESSQSFTGTDAKKKNTANGTGLALNDMESSDIFRKSDDARGKEVRRSVETFWLLEQIDSAREKTANQDPEEILLDVKTENIHEKQEIPTEIVMVPQRVDKDNECVFIIFTSLLNDIKNIYILLERNIIKEIPIHLLNPYVVFFFVPEQFLNVQGIVNVHIRYDNQLLDVKFLNVGSASQTPCCRCLLSEATSPLDLTPVADFSMFEDDVTVIQTDNEEDNPCDVSDFSKTDENELDDNTVRSFLKFFALYGFGEQDDFALEILNEGNDQEQKSFEVLLSDCQVSENVTLRDATSHKKETLLRSSLVLPSVRTTSDLRRSASLPSLPTTTSAPEDNENEELVEMEEYNESEGSIETGYMEMSPRYTGKKPHEIALAELLNGDTDSNQLNSISSNIYVSMKPNLEDANNDAAVNNLCESQKELLDLLKAFKTGGMTFQDVETAFKEWISKHGDSVDYRDVTFRQHDDEDTVQKERKRQSFGFADIVRLISGKPKKKTKIKAQPQEAKAQQKTDKVRDRHLKTLSKISDSSASSAWSLSSNGNQETCQIPPTNGNQERKRDSGNHSDSNEDSKNKMLTEDEKSTKWFIIPPSISTVPYCPASGEGTPPSLPSRPPPSVPIINERRLNLPNRLPPIPREMPAAPPAPPPKRAIIQMAAVSLDQVQSNQKKKKSKDTTTKAKKTPRDASPDYITVTNHPLSPPNTRDQFKQATQPNLSQIRRNNYAMERLKLSTDPPRKSSAPEMRARSNSPRNITNIPTISRVAISPLIFSQKEHHMRYNKPLIPGSRRSVSCPNLLKPKEKEEKVHTYIELQGDSNHSQNKSYLHSNKGQESKLADPPPLPPRS